MAEQVSPRKPGPETSSAWHVGELTTPKGSPFHNVVESRGRAKSLLFILKQGLKMPFTAIPLFSIEQDTMGAKTKMRPYGEAGITRAPTSVLKCWEEAWEEDASSCHRATCCAHCLPGISNPSGYLALRLSFQAKHVRRPVCPHISASLPFLCGRKKTRKESLWPLSVCTGCLSGVRW